MVILGLQSVSGGEGARPGYILMSAGAGTGLALIQVGQGFHDIISKNFLLHSYTSIQTQKLAGNQVLLMSAGLGSGSGCACQLGPELVEWGFQDQAITRFICNNYFSGQLASVVGCSGDG